MKNLSVKELFYDFSEDDMTTAQSVLKELLALSEAKEILLSPEVLGYAEILAVIYRKGYQDGRNHSIAQGG